MEKKTIGNFLAALRKANGLTQRELAEKLGVSDKAVSRWERDECAPDLSLIPVIAEIFGITADELLRGQRNAPTSPPADTAPDKTRHQLKHILEENRTRFLIRSLIALGVGLVGLIAAMICNFGFLRAYIGFFLGCVFYVTAGILEASFATLAFSAVRGDEFPAGEVESHRKTLGKITLTVSLTLGLLFVLTLPLLTQCGDAYWGITGESWFAFALIYALLAAGVTLAVFWVYQGVRLNRMGKTTDPTVIRARKRRAVQKRTLLWVALVLAITFAGQVAFNAAFTPTDFAHGIVFQNMDDFRVFAETPTANLEASYGDTAVRIEPSDSISSSDVLSDFYVVAPNPDAWDAIAYYDQYGNVITEEQALTRYLFEEGNEEYKYIHRNESIAVISPSGETGYFPVTVYTHGQWQSGDQIMNLCNVGFVGLYVVELLAGLVVCIIRSRKTRI